LQTQSCEKRRLLGLRFSIEQFKAFIDQPPEWLVIEFVSKDLLIFLCELPAEIQISNGSIKPLEWADAIYVATAMNRGKNSLRAATDQSIKAIPIMNERTILYVL